MAGNLKHDTGAAPSIVTEGNLYDWISKQVKHEEEAPLRLSNKNFFLPLNEISITSKPWSEQDVIVLFNQLVAGGVIRGIRLLATSQTQQYDSIYRYYVSEPLKHHIFNKDSNPLGVQELAHDKAFASKPYVLEYKYSIDALIQDFETGMKGERDIALVVAWEMGSEWKKRYLDTSLLDLDNIQHRPFHGLTHIFRDENTGDVRFHAIVLCELLEYLENVDGVQEFHRSAYADPNATALPRRRYITNQAACVRHRGSVLSKGQEDNWCGFCFARKQNPHPIVFPGTLRATHL